MVNSGKNVIDKQRPRYSIARIEYEPRPGGLVLE
jgi:hypothetical protein